MFRNTAILNGVVITSEFLLDLLILFLVLLQLSFDIIHVLERMSKQRETTRDFTDRFRALQISENLLLVALEAILLCKQCSKA